MSEAGTAQTLMAAAYYAQWAALVFSVSEGKVASPPWAELLPARQQAWLGIAGSMSVGEALQGIIDRQQRMVEVMIVGVTSIARGTGASDDAIVRLGECLKAVWEHGASNELLDKFRTAEKPPGTTMQ